MDKLNNKGNNRMLAINRSYCFLFSPPAIAVYVFKSCSCDIQYTPDDSFSTKKKSVKMARLECLSNYAFNGVLCSTVHLRFFSS